ncbi:MAG: LPS assembly lipoprotein LptE [Desulfurella sp.]|uniref:LPS assembly lipoprotein LptE n=1 Tax=Desulfurella sp. TaxID=1962857 RepID=UPI003D133804
MKKATLEIKNFFKIIFLIVIPFILASCGYRAATHSSIIDNIKTVYVETPKNSTSNPDIALYLKKSIINELIAHNIKVVDQKLHAQGYLETDITSYSVDPSLFNSEGLPIVYRCMITISLTLKDRDGKALILNKLLTSFADFKANNREIALQIAKNSVQQKVLDQLAVLVREDLFINF